MGFHDKLYILELEKCDIRLFLLLYIKLMKYFSDQIDQYLKLEFTILIMTFSNSIIQCLNSIK